MKQFLIVLLVMGFASAALAQGPDGWGTGELACASHRCMSNSISAS